MVDFAPDPLAGGLALPPPAVRQAVHQLQSAADTLVLLISELVTNAVVHTGCPAVLRMLFGGPGVRVEVMDTSDCPPARRHAEDSETSGRGLELVDGLADRWGWQREATGKRIWCEIDHADKTPEPTPRPHMYL
ncbi:ATP-binding protein [Streptomyces sp. 12297]